MIHRGPKQAKNKQKTYVYYMNELTVATSNLNSITEEIYEGTTKNFIDVFSLYFLLGFDTKKVM